MKTIELFFGINQDSYIKHLLNEKEQVAEINQCRSKESEIIIPRSITYNSKEYIIKSILKNTFIYLDDLKIVRFSEDSELQKIEEDAFLFSNVESVSIPSSVIELQNGCFGLNTSLTKVTIDPKNPYYQSYEDKFIIKKSSSEKVDFDVLFFGVNGIDEVIIPNFIEIIASKSFNQKHIKNVSFQVDSKLRIIEKNAFKSSLIHTIKFPPHLTEICERAFFGCEALQMIEFPDNSELQIIGENAFYGTNIRHVKFPPHLTQIRESSFSQCWSLQQIEFPENSELQVIQKAAFFESSIECISIPATVIELQKGWCEKLRKVNRINVSPKNESYSSYDDIFIIGKSSQEKENFDVLVFACRNVTKVTIPEFIETIGPNAFEECVKLRTVEMISNSKIYKIEKYAFCSSSIEAIEFPLHLTHVCEKAFYCCENLKKIAIPSNSELRVIEKGAFKYSSIKSFCFPENFIEFDQKLFLGLYKLQIVEFNVNIEITQIKNGKMFSSDCGTIFMIPVVSS